MGSDVLRQEVDEILEWLEEHLPIAREEWNDASRLHAKRYSEFYGTVDRLKRKFPTFFIALKFVLVTSLYLSLSGVQRNFLRHGCER